MHSFTLPGGGIAADVDKAVSLFLEAADAGDPFAMTRIGTMYENGTGLKPQRDLSKALYWYRRASKGGDVIAAGALERLRLIIQERFRKLGLAALLLSLSGLTALVLNQFSVLPSLTGPLAGLCLAGDVVLSAVALGQIRKYT